MSTPTARKNSPKLLLLSIGASTVFLTAALPASAWQLGERIVLQPQAEATEWRPGQPIILRPPGGPIAAPLTTAPMLSTLPIPVSPLVAPQHAYNFEYKDPYFSTLTSRLLKPSREAKILMLDELPGRDQVAILGPRAKIEITAYVQAHPAPLMFVIPGLGGTAIDGSAQWLAEQYFDAGFSALVMPSPFSWKFVLSQSTTGVPGFTPADVSDLMAVMKQARELATSRLRLRYTRQAVVGYSLGAVHAAFVRKMDHERPYLGIERAIMIDPPLDFRIAIPTLDRLQAIGKRYSFDQREIIMGGVIKAGSALLARDVKSPDYFVGLDRALRLDTDQAAYLIGASFRETLRDAIFASQQIIDLGLLHIPASSYRRSARQSEAARISFQDYIGKGSYPFWKQRLGVDWSLDRFFESCDLRGLRAELIKDPAYRLIHNADDFLNQPDDLAKLARAMGRRATIYPYGGHVGNLWQPETRAMLLRNAQDLLN